MQSAAAARLEALHQRVVSVGETAPDRALAAIEEFGALLKDSAVARKHYYWNHFYYYKVRLLIEQKRLGEALDLAREGTAGDPAYPGLWRLKGSAEYELGYLVDAFRSLKIAARLRGDTRYAVSRMLQILLRRRRYRIGAKFGRHALAGAEFEPSFRLLMAQIELGAGDAEAALSHLDAFENAAGATDHTRYVRRMAESLQTHRPHQHVAIAGMSYVGSTLMGTVLGSLPGCAHAGETQELIHRANPKAYEFPIIDFASDPPEAIPQCRVCGAACPVFTRAFRAELVRDPVDWYFKIARQMGAETIISSDKFLSEYLSKDPLFRFDLVILYKPLEAWVYSHLREEARRAANGGVTSPVARDLVRVLDQWAHNYYGFLKDLRPTGRRLVIDWERFAERPRDHFELMLKKLKLPGDASAFENVRAPHYVGGNDGIVPVLRAGRVSFRPSRAEALGPEDQAIVDAHQAAQSVRRLLDTCYRNDFRELFL
jgi:hypothetical protein